MCGIVGHVVQEGIPDVKGVKLGMAALIHRGPDDDGMVQMPQACLGHRRLSIIDVDGSPQPWQSPDGRYSLVFNGEIYNYIELRAALEREGFRFRSQGDTEVLLAMFIHKGADCLNEFNGMFAFAVWDAVEKKLFLARDRLGKKPLYYALTKRGIVFASEIDALNAFSEIDRAIDLNAAHDFFAHQYIGGPRTIYRGVRKLPAGHYLVYTRDKVAVNGYWAPPLPHLSSRPVPELCEELRALVDDAVRLRLRSDVPLGSFLSGGLDSSLIVSSMKRAGVDVQSFTIGFRESSYDESEDASFAARYFSSNHRERVLDMDVIGKITECFEAFGEPFADPSALPTAFLCQHTRQYVTVALSGDGVDELFGGYRRYYARRFAGMVQSLPRKLRSDILPRIASCIPENETYYGNSRLKQLKLFLRLVRAIDESPRDPLAQVFTLNERLALFNETPPELDNFDCITQFGLDNLDPVSQMIMADVHTYLVDDILVKVDRMSMHQSLEVRSPFLDYRIVEFACALPLDLKIHNGMQKFLVRESYRGQLPEQIMSRRKHGFAIPLPGWFRGFLKPVFESVVLYAAIPEFLNRKEIDRLWIDHQAGRADNGFKLWCLLAFCHWYNHQYVH